METGRTDTTDERWPILEPVEIIERIEFRRRQPNRSRSSDIVFHFHDVETEGGFVDSAGKIQSKERETPGRERSANPVRPVSDRWLAPILKVTCFETHPFHRCSFLRAYFRRRFLPTCLPQEGIYVSCYPVFYCNANRVHRKKF